MKPTPEQLKELLRIVAATEQREIDCEEFLARVGAYLENLDSDAKKSTELQLVAQHLKICRECREEYEALIEAHGDGD